MIDGVWRVEKSKNGKWKMISKYEGDPEIKSETNIYPSQKHLDDELVKIKQNRKVK